LRQGLLLWKNPEALNGIREQHLAARADVWLLHNVIPVISLDVYHLGRKLGVPLIQWLHNYRPFSPGGTLFVEGRLLRPDDPWLRWKEVWQGSWNGRLATALLTLGYARLRLRRDFEAVRAWVPVSDEMKRIFERADWYPERLHTCRHSWHAQPAPTEARDDGHFLFLGRMVESKGVRFLLQLWEAPELREVPLVMAGDGPLVEELKARSASNVRWVGHVEGETKRHLKAGCRAILFPSIWPEPLSTVAYEAYEMKKPILASNAGGMPEVVLDGRTGLLLPPGDRAAWLAAVLRLARDPGLSRELGQQGRRWLEDEVSPRRWVERFNQIARRAGIFDRLCAG
jgi:glycosyltransferase involved in cell wall biosynthesis